MTSPVPEKVERKSSFSSHSPSNSRRGSSASEKMVKVEKPGSLNGENDDIDSDNDELLDEESKSSKFTCCFLVDFLLFFTMWGELILTLLFLF